MSYCVRPRLGHWHRFEIYMEDHV
ncbi:hypothetical protein F383_05871 [Gossypium arboreum]|uniref:Uncharacterized protein n=1 Tax=Gossypium arboreum TaxID=29729 RepID=A0A0B0PNS3_GOSAR|nr:hypothetical protein F383_05871 [Gossypium arboreum]